MGTEAVLGLVVPPLLVIGIVVGLRLISRFEEATEQADETRRKSATGERRRERRRKLKELSDDGARK